MSELATPHAERDLRTMHTMPQGLCRAEIRAVEGHQRALVAKRGREISFDEALDDWVQTSAESWRKRRQEVMMAIQREEMLRHKWIESEKAQRDVGKEVYLEWIKRYAAEWRRWYESQEEHILQRHNLL